MKLCIRAALSILFLWSLGNAQVIRDDTKPVFVRYQNGTVERYVVRWIGSVDVKHWEDGHPSEPLKGWFTDTRQCHWEITNTIVRRVYFLNQNGEQFVKEDLTTPLRSTSANKGSDLKLTQLRPENCGDTTDRFNSDVKDATTSMNNSFPAATQSDYEVVKAAIKAWPSVIAVNDTQPQLKRNASLRSSH